MSDVVKKNLGAVTAYKYAVSKGYTGTEEEFAELMASYATVAEGAAASATAASGFATAAANSASAAQAAAEEAAESIPEDYSELSNDVVNLKNYVSVDIPWHDSNNYPTGWYRGYHSGNVGDEISISTTDNYLRLYYPINASNYPALSEAVYLEIIPPADYCVRIHEIDRDTQLITRMQGELNSSMHPELKGVPQKIDVKQNCGYRISLGRFNGDSGDYNNSTFISTIKCRLWVNKADDTPLPNTSTGTGTSLNTRQFFSVTVDRPLSFSGEEIVTTTETVEAVLQLPDIYRVEGAPVPLVLMCHGAGGYIEKSTGTWYNSNWKTLCNALLTAGFAIFDVNVLPTSMGTDQMGYCMGSPLAVNVAKAAYDYVVSHYNVQRHILVHGTSMGGVLASAFVKAYPNLCIAQSSFAGRDLTQYIHSIKYGSLESADEFAIAYGYENYADLIADKFSHADGLSPSLSLRKYTSGAVTIPPERESAFSDWVDYYAEIQDHEKNDTVGEYTAYRSVPYKSWNSWADNVGHTKAEQILQKAYAAGGSAPYLCVIYDSGSHTEMSYGQINNMIPQLIAWFKRWLP